MITLNTKEIIENLDNPSNKDFMQTWDRQQVGYGNDDCFEITIRNVDDIEFQFGENWIRFWFRHDGTIHDTSGMGQGHKFQDRIEEVVKEIREKVIFGEIYRAY